MRLYSNGALDTVLTDDPGAGGTTILVLDTTGWPSPGSGDSALGVIDTGNAAVEIFEYTGKTSTSFTGCLRGVDGTSAGSHNVGVAVRHMGSAEDLESFMRHGEVGLATMLASSWYGPNNALALTNGAPAVGDMRSAQFSVPSRQRFVGIGIEIVAAVASSFARLMIYKDNGSGKPGTLVLDAGTVSGAATGFLTKAIDVTLPRGLYHVALMTEGVAANVRTINGAHGVPARLPQPTTGTAPVSSWRNTGTATGAAPSPFPSGAVTISGGVYVMLQTAA